MSSRSAGILPAERRHLAGCNPLATASGSVPSPFCYDFGNPMIHSARVLIVSADAQFDLMRAGVEARGFEVTVAHAHEDAFRRLLESSFDLVVIDLAQAPRDIEFIQRLRETPKLSKTFVLVVGEWGTGQPTLGLSHGADAYEPKPVDAGRLGAAVERVLRRPLAVAE